MSPRQRVGVPLSLIACAATLIASPGGYLFAKADPPDEKPTIEIKILRQTDKYFDIDIGMDMPIRIYREHILYMAKHLPLNIGRLFTVKTGSGVPVNILLDDDALEKLKTAKLNTSEEGFVVENFVFGKIVFKDLTPPPENIHKLPEEQVRLNEQLIAAAKEGRTFDVVALLSQGANPNARRGLAYNKVPSKQMMLDVANREEGYAGVEIDDILNQQAAAHNETPLEYAARNNYMDIAGLLLQAGADPNTALGTTVAYRYVELAKLLLEHGAKPISPSALVAMPFAYRASNAEIEATQAHDVELAQMLISHGADVNAQDRDGNTTTLPSLCNAGYLIHGPDIIDLVIRAGAAVNRPGWMGQPPLFNCMGNDRNVELLLNAGANVHVRNWEGKTFVAIALSTLRQWKGSRVPYEEGYVKTIRRLLAAGAGADATPEELNELLQLMPKE